MTPFIFWCVLDTAPYCKKTDTLTNTFITTVQTSTLRHCCVQDCLIRKLKPNYHKSYRQVWLCTNYQRTSWNSFCCKKKNLPTTNNHDHSTGKYFLRQTIQIYSIHTKYMSTFERSRQWKIKHRRNQTANLRYTVRIFLETNFEGKGKKPMFPELGGRG